MKLNQEVEKKHHSRELVGSQLLMKNQWDDITESKTTHKDDDGVYDNYRSSFYYYILPSWSEAHSCHAHATF